MDFGNIQTIQNSATETVELDHRKSGNEGEITTQIPLEEINDVQDTPVSYFVVCDGHGGSQAADFVCEHLYSFILAQECFDEDPTTAILNAFAETEKKWNERVESEEMDGMLGTTVTATLLIGNDLYIANVGDSEAVLCSKGG